MTNASGHPDQLELLSRTAERALAHPYKVWGYGEGQALRAVVQAADRLRRPDLVDHVADLVTPRLAAGPDEEHDHLTDVDLLTALHARRPDLAIDDAIERFVHAVAGAPHPVVGRPAVHRPHHPELGRTIWVDCLHTDGPGLVAAGRPDDAVGVVTEAVGVLQLPSGLFQHGYDVTTGRGNGVAWARGQGWVLLGLVGLLRGVPDPYLRERLERLVSALAEVERSGRWTTIVDDPDSPAEVSLSPMVGVTVRAAVTAGVLDGRWQPMADRALAATFAAMGADGTLSVSEATPVGAAASYRSRAEGVFPWGQGPLLDALLVSTDLEADR